MAKNPVEQFFQNVGTFSQCVQTQLSSFFQSLQKNDSILKKKYNSPCAGISTSSNRVLSKSSRNRVGDEFTGWQAGTEIESRSVLETKEKHHVRGSLDAAHLKGDFQGTDDVFDAQSTIKGKSGRPVSKEELGRATWTLLHTLAAQFPDKPTKQQKRDVKELMSILSRLYPCKECADHFKEVLKGNPVQADSGVELAQWMCRVHNVVNRSLAKPNFPCQRVDARWGALECNEGACDLQGRTHPFIK